MIDTNYFGWALLIYLSILALCAFIDWLRLESPGRSHV